MMPNTASQTVANSFKDPPPGRSGPCGVSVPFQVPKQDISKPQGTKGAPFMLSKEENEIITRVGPGTPMGNTIRRYWVPALLASEIPGPDCAPTRVRLLGEDLVAF